MSPHKLKPNQKDQISISIEKPENQHPNSVDVLFVRKSKYRLDMNQLKEKCPEFVAQHFQIKETDQEVDQFEIRDLEPEVFVLLMRFLVKGKKPSKDDLEKYAVKLLEAANKYKIDSLKQICDRYLSSYMRFPVGDRLESSYTSLALEQLDIAMTVDAPKLKSRCFNEINMNYGTVRGRKKWEHLVQTHPTLYQQMYDILYSERNSPSNKIAISIIFVILIGCILWTGWSLFAAL